MSLIILWAAVFVCMPLMTEVFHRFWNRGLSVKVFFGQEQIEEGQSVMLKEQIENRKIMPLLTLTVKFKLNRNIAYANTENTRRTDYQYRNDCISVMSYQRVTRSFKVVGTKRGYYPLREIDITAADFLFRKIYMERAENHAALYVYPMRSRLVRLDEVFHLMYGAYLTNRLVQEDPFAFKGIRDYAPTDPMGKINWKATARTGSLKVNQFFNTTSQQLTIFLNMDHKKIRQYEDLMEESIRIARNFIEDFMQKGIPVILISNGVDQMTGHEVFQQEGAGRKQVDFYLKQLARIDIYRQVRSMEELLKEQAEQRHGMASGISLLISAEQSKELAEAYRDYVGNSDASWLVPIYADMEPYMAQAAGSENGIHMEYLVMEQII